MSAMHSRNESLDHHCSTQLSEATDTLVEPDSILFTSKPESPTSRIAETALENLRHNGNRAPYLLTRPEHTILCSLMCQGKPEDCT